MDLEILRELFTGCKKAAEILGDAVDEAEIPDDAVLPCYLSACVVLYLSC